MSSAYLISEGEPRLVRCGSLRSCRTPAASSSPCNATFNNNGLMTPPCGVPASVGANPLSGSNTPAFSHCRIFVRPGNIPMVARRWSWSILSNAAVRSASSTHKRCAVAPHEVTWITEIASWQLRPGLNP